MELRGKDGFPDQRNLRDLALLGFLTSLKVHMMLLYTPVFWSSLVPCPLFDGKWWNEEKTGSHFGGFAVMAGEATRMDGSLKWLIGWGGAAIM